MFQSTLNSSIGEMIQSLVSQCPPFGPGHMTSVQCRIRTILREIAFFMFSQGYINMIKEIAINIESVFVSLP